MFLFKKKRLHEREAKELKIDINKQFVNARRSVAQNKRTLQNNGITLEIRKALGGNHV